MPRANLSSLDVFVAVATNGVFRGAARDLGLSPSAVSHAVNGLEDRLGVRLLSRTTRSVALTDAGRRLLEQLQPALRDIDRALADASEIRSVPSGLLRLSVPRSVTHYLLLPRLAAFASAYPDVTIEIRADDALVDIVAEGFDAGIRLGESLQKDMVAVRIGSEQRMVAVVAPSIMGARKAPVHPSDLAAFPCVATRFPGGALYDWEFEKDNEAIAVAVRGPFIVNDTRVALDAAVAGVGIAYVMESMAVAVLASGEIVRILEDWCPTFAGFSLYYPSRRQMRPALRAFIDVFTAKWDRGG